jgi:filamentous hemagglutinin family protein
MKLSHLLYLTLPVASTAFGAGNLPTGGTVVAGSASMTTPNANTLVVTQQTNRAVINWNRFDIGAGYSVQIQQPTANSGSMHRVVSAGTPSQIQGALTSNGNVFLMNPNGIVVGPSGSISAGSIYLGTGNIADADFMAGNTNFTAPSAGSSIVLNGTLNAGNVLDIRAASMPDVNGATLNAGSININTGAIAPPLIPSGSISVSSGIYTGGYVSGTINLNSTNPGISNWSSFAIATGGQINFVQSPNLAVLNRVSGGGTVSIGQPVITGKVMAIASRGVLPTITPVSALPIARPIAPAAAPVRPVAMSAPRPTPSLVDGAVSVRLPVVDIAPISLR